MKSFKNEIQGFEHLINWHNKNVEKRGLKQTEIDEMSRDHLLHCLRDANRRFLIAIIFGVTFVTYGGFIYGVNAFVGAMTFLMVIPYFISAADCRIVVYPDIVREINRKIIQRNTYASSFLVIAIGYCIAEALKT